MGSRRQVNNNVVLEIQGNAAQLNSKGTQPGLTIQTSEHQPNEMMPPTMMASPMNQSQPFTDMLNLTTHEGGAGTPLGNTLQSLSGVEGIITPEQMFLL